MPSINCRNCGRSLSSSLWCAPCGIMHWPEGTPWPVAKPSKKRGRTRTKSATRQRTKQPTEEH